ncbi:MAG TPA: FecR family protein [Planctomycetota bacterium]|nr:FecR family protein [Planctomycetota bacterium]
MSRDEFERLCEEYLKSVLPLEQRERLAAYLESDPQALREFVDQVQLHQGLNELHAARDPQELATSVLRELRYAREAEGFSRAVVERVNSTDARRARFRVKFIAAAAAACVLLSLVLLQYSKAPVNPPAQIAAIMQSAPGARLIRDGNTVEISAETALQNGDLLATAGDAGTLVELADKTRITVGAQTELSFTESSAGAQLSIPAGNIDLKVAPQAAGRKLSVVTPQATAEVLGTVFSVSVDGSSTTLSVSEGRVRFTRSSDGRQLEVSAGQSAVSAPDAAFGIRESATAVAEVKASGRQMLFIVGDTALNAGDRAIAARLKGRGDEVLTLALNDVTPEQISSARMILVSSTIVLEGDALAQEFGRRLKESRAAVIVWEPRLYPELGISAGDNHGRDWGTVLRTREIRIAQQGHPLALKRSGAIEVTTEPAQLSWGRASEKATMIATAENDPSKAMLFVYERGATLADGTAAQGARGGIFLFDTAAGKLSATGWSLFDALCDWSWDRAPKQ